MMNRIFLLLPAVLLGCEFGDNFVPYYSPSAGDPAPPTITGLDITSEVGTVGGQVVTVNGSNFGDDPSVVTVVFGSQNANIVGIIDTAMQIEVPRGPVEGGFVTVGVGTLSGQARMENAYQYEVDDMYEGQVAFLSVTNDYFSCLGGVGHPYGDFCSSWSMSGSAGIEGRGEFLEFDFPRVHAPFTGYRGGFGGTTDASWGEWAIETPSQDMNTFDFEDLYSDLRLEVGNFSLVNPLLEGDRWCQDMTAAATYRYSGSEEYGSYDVMGGSWLEEADCDDAWSREYDLGTMNFCQENDYDVNRSLRYLPDWPVGEYFFQGEDDDGDPSSDVPVDVELTVPELGLNQAMIQLPEAAVFYGTKGFYDDGTLTGDEETDQRLALIAGFDEDCATNGEGDRSSSGDDVGLRWEWSPSDADLEAHGDVEAARSYVRATVSYVQQGWLGGSGTPIRAVINVPDDHGYDEETGHSVLELPASVLYQFPSAYQDKGSKNDPIFGGFRFNSWGDPERPDYGYIITTIERVTEYQIPVEGGAHLVFSYSTGDLGYRLFFLGGDGFSSWINPLEASDTACGDCTDNDGDGWQDAADPDCGEGAEEDDSNFGLYTCNDGIDNDDDGLTDADDPGCEDGYDGETNCFDNEDNDGDGLVDEEDGECGELGSGFQLGNDDPAWGCINALDDDGDGWVDFDDPDCESGSDQEVGFGDLACNNGLDDDGHGDVDGDDPYCAFRGASADSEEPTNRSGDCADKVDNDGDLYIDANDPDCEFQPYNLEDNGNFDPADWMISDECINELDDDGDGAIDAEDSGCTNEAGEPDGFQPSETDGTENYCANGADDDGDGWTDEDDPDCMTIDGGEPGTEETGLGVSECNDGIDNDSDTFVDSEDPECAFALDNSEDVAGDSEAEGGEEEDPSE